MKARSLVSAIWLWGVRWWRHRLTFHPEEAVMTYEEFFRERRDARYAVSKGRFRACC